MDDGVDVDNSIGAGEKRVGCWEQQQQQQQKKREGKLEQKEKQKQQTGRRREHVLHNRVDFWIHMQ